MQVNMCVDAGTLQRFVEGRLSSAEMDEVEAHVEHCSGCFEAMRRLPEASLVAGLGAAQEWPAELAEPAFADNLIQQVLRRCADAASATSNSGDAGTIPCESSAEPEAKELLDFLALTQEAGELGRLGPYRIFKVLGKGGMGIVCLAEDMHLKRRVALKVMKPALAANTAARQRFLGEAEKTAAIKHDHIVTIYQVGNDRGIPFLAMELLEGEVLAERLSNPGEITSRLQEGNAR